MSQTSDVERLLTRSLNCELLGGQVIQAICKKVKERLIQEPNVKDIPAPVTVVGDVHGQFFDLLEMFKIGGMIPYSNYLFLGDYVDRGGHSIETITLLFLLKIRYPSRVTLLRGNHETRQITQVYGFFAECERKYGSSVVWQAFTSAFDFLPVAALIDGVYLGVHGGLSPNAATLDEIRSLDRIGEIPHQGALADLMWSDPAEDKMGYTVSPRGAGYVFGRDIAERFCHDNGLQTIYRAHQLCMHGYQVCLGGFVVTVWSAPNYLYRFGNKGCCLEIYENRAMYFNLFDPAPEFDRHPVGATSPAPAPVEQPAPVSLPPLPPPVSHAPPMTPPHRDTHRDSDVALTPTSPSHHYHFGPSGSIESEPVGQEPLPMEVTGPGAEFITSPQPLRPPPLELLAGSFNDHCTSRPADGLGPQKDSPYPVDDNNQPIEYTKDIFMFAGTKALSNGGQTTAENMGLASPPSQVDSPQNESRQERSLTIISSVATSPLSQKTTTDTPHSPEHPNSAEAYSDGPPPFVLPSQTSSSENHDISLAPTDDGIATGKPEPQELVEIGDDSVETSSMEPSSFDAAQRSKGYQTATRSSIPGHTVIGVSGPERRRKVKIRTREQQGRASVGSEDLSLSPSSTPSSVSKHAPQSRDASDGEVDEMEVDTTAENTKQDVAKRQKGEGGDEVDVWSQRKLRLIPSGGIPESDAAGPTPCEVNVRLARETNEVSPTSPVHVNGVVSLADSSEGVNLGADNHSEGDSEGNDQDVETFLSPTSPPSSPPLQSPWEAPITSPSLPPKEKETGESKDQPPSEAGEEQKSPFTFVLADSLNVEPTLPVPVEYSGGSQSPPAGGVASPQEKALRPSSAPSLTLAKLKQVGGSLGLWSELPRRSSEWSDVESESSVASCFDENIPPLNTIVPQDADTNNLGENVKKEDNFAEESGPHKRVPNQTTNQSHERYFI
eukprot:GHVN01059909.1.p1 GENE.GHVN01059909.1~~GHVN01059909.1.p1  ORF type:complete len:949 (+),score=181.18 GHVN01059909.1:2772-5618(+)